MKFETARDLSRSLYLKYKFDPVIELTQNRPDKSQLENYIRLLEIYTVSVHDLDTVKLSKQFIDDIESTVGADFTLTLDNTSTLTISNNSIDTLEFQTEVARNTIDTLIHTDVKPYSIWVLANECTKQGQDWETIYCNNPGLLQEKTCSKIDSILE